MRAHLWLSLCLSFGLAALGGCIRQKSGYCTSDDSCAASGKRCDTRTMGCVPYDDASTNDAPPDTSLPSDGRDGPDGPSDGSVDSAGDGGGSADASDASDASRDVAASCADAACPTGQNCGVSLTCFSCQSDKDCAGNGSKPACDMAFGLCVACTGNSHCGDGGVCDQRDAGTHYTCVGCTASAPAPDAGTAKPDAGTTDASVPGQCSASKPVCDDRTSATTINTCIECRTSDDCSGAKPVCDGKTNTCVPCVTDTECTGGDRTCLPTGQCATTGQVIFVQKMTTSDCPDNGTNTGGGTIKGNGTQQSPYCLTENAIADLKATKNVIVLQGLGSSSSSGALGRIRIVNRSGPVFVLGRQQAVVSCGPTETAALDIQSSNVVVQSLQVKNASNLGVSVQGGSLTMDRCLVTGNHGGIRLANGSFDIENTIVANNVLITDDASVTWSELRIESLASGGTAKLINDTFVAAADSYPSLAITPSVSSPSWVTAGLLLATDKKNNIDNAKVPLCCSGSTTDLKLASDFSLTATSPAMCLDQVATTSGAAYDYLGKKRPGGSSSDCGAFELFPAATNSSN